jgi:hypothetical protein
MKHREHRPEVKFGLQCLLIRKLNQKTGGHVLMTKFGKSEKIGPFDSLFRIVRFQ